VVINGTVEAGLEVMAGYVYSDAENDAESGTTFQWYLADDVSGSGESAIEGATSANYTIDPLYEFKYLRVAVTPMSSTGAQAGEESTSSWSQIAEASTYEVFTYNGETVAYGIITSSVTGRKWLDRNMGAQKAADSIRDYKAYGDLFQWGRAADGHQLTNWTQSLGDGGYAGGVPVNSSTTNVLSTTDVPVDNLFITASALPRDWRNPQNITLWNPAGGYVNNPCPSGWHVPTFQEWEDEHLEADFVEDKEMGEITNELRLTAAGKGRRNTGPLYFSSTGYELFYWTSELSDVGGGIYYGYGYMTRFYLPQFENADHVSNAWGTTVQPAASGIPCRCIKNE
jgi:uncharacterized protein (TIGR02145 family)